MIVLAEYILLLIVFHFEVTDFGKQWETIYQLISNYEINVKFMNVTEIPFIFLI